MLELRKATMSVDQKEYSWVVLKAHLKEYLRDLQWAGLKEQKSVQTKEKLKDVP